MVTGFTMKNFIYQSLNEYSLLCLVIQVLDIIRFTLVIAFFTKKKNQRIAGFQILTVFIGEGHEQCSSR